MPRELSFCESVERSLIKKYRKQLWNPFVAAVKRYELVRAGDRIAVCISGGKDSMLLAKLMQELQRHTDRPFHLEFMAMDPGYRPDNRRLLEENAERLGIPLTVFESDIFDVTVQVEKNPCYLCARMRRGFQPERTSLPCASFPGLPSRRDWIFWRRTCTPFCRKMYSCIYWAAESSGMRLFFPR